MRRVLTAGLVGVTLSACALFAGLEDKRLLEEPVEASSPDATADAGFDAPSAPPIVETVLADLRRPTAVAVDVNYLFLTEEAAGTVKRLRKGDTAPVLMARKQPMPAQLLLDAQFVYWRNTNAAKNAGDTFFDSVVRLDKTKDDATTPSRLVFEESTKPSEVQGIALFEGLPENVIYYTRNSEVRRKLRTDGQDSELARDQKLPTAIAADSLYVYWVAEGEYAIKRRFKVVSNVDGGPPPPIETMYTSPDLRKPLALAVDEQSLYWLNEAGAVLKSAKTPGAPPTELAMSGPTGSGWLVLDAESVYWTNTARGTVSVVDKNGTDATKRVLATDQLEPRGIAIDSLDLPRRVYWAASTAILRVSLP